MNQAHRDYFNDFVSVEIAQAVSRIICKYKELEEKEQKETKPDPTEDINHERVSEKYSNREIIEDHAGLVLRLYWKGGSSEEIADIIGVVPWLDVESFLFDTLPIELILEKYNGGMYPSKIARLPDVRLTTNQVRRVLNMDPV